MNEKIARALKNIEEVNAVVSRLDPAIKAMAFEKISAMLFEDESSEPLKRDIEDADGAKVETSKPADTSSLEKFFSQFSTEKPAENVSLVAAWLFSQRGTNPFSLEEVQAVADSIGLTVPARIDKTLISARRKGKALFQKQNGGFAPTISGELFLKQTYRVRKGAATPGK